MMRKKTAVRVMQQGGARESVPSGNGSPAHSDRCGQAINDEAHQMKKPPDKDKDPPPAIEAVRRSSTTV